MVRTHRAAASLFFLLAGPALAQSATPDSENGRYGFHRVPEGVLRLDMRTGQVSLCTSRAIGWTCQTVADERPALENEIARLQNENAVLKKDLLTRGLPLPGTVKPDPKSEFPKSDGPSAKRGEPELKLPSHADLERMKSFLEKIWHRFVEMISNLQKDMRKT